MKTTIAFILSLVFLVHPINVEAVSYIASLQIVLSMFFGLMAFLACIRQKRNDMKTALLIFVLILCSLLSKETGIIFLILLLPFMKLFSTATIANKKYLYTGLASGLSAVIYLLLRYVISSTPIVTDFSSSPVPIMQATIAERLMTLPKILFFYIETFFFPINLAISQNWIVKTIDQNTFFLPLIVDLFFIVILIVPVLYFFIKRKKFVPFCIFFLVWFFVSWGIHWNIIPLDMTVAERWFYVALAGLLGLVGVIINTINVKQRNLQVTVLWAAIVLLLLFSIRTIQRNQDWSSPLVLYAHDSQISTESFDLENSYANTLLLQKRYDEAYPHIQKSIKLAPEYWESWSNLGVYYEGKGQIDRSIDAFSIAITKNKNYHHAYMNLANMYFYYKSPGTARTFLAKARSVFPNDPQFLLFGGVTEYKLGNKQQAMDMVMQAYTITKDPTFLNAYQEMQQNVEIK